MTVYSYKGRMIASTTEVFVYRNLHRDQWSVKAMTGPHKGKVVGHADQLTLFSCELKVSEAGRQRVLREGRKNVHAGVIGLIVDDDVLHTDPTGIGPLEGPRKVSYNPRRAGAFTVNDQPVDAADYIHFAATGGVGMDKVRLGRLRSFYKKLQDQVLEFDPAIPPIPGVSNKGGWRYVPRTADDGDLLIRVNDYTDLTEQGRMIWRLPPVSP
ncbi:hypothetical protein KIV63_gp15 [Mycobacterium phage SWU2]|uniref:Uncharacterized protein n=1 Tax=Mycobacterium phage SWU2 TaxID=2077150 RepID=A0A2K9VI93_9CAUD|nr:hypothetical protein KIV63_gp15 [Mycobacterium phage SWU2]AUV62029.1 hypothetical protein JX_gp70 [Mycobacterium phage SWU2]